MIQPTQRTKILDAWAARLGELYGPTGTEKIFRSIRRGAWKPGNPTRPALTIVDDGQEITAHELDDKDNDPSLETGSCDAILKIKLILDLEENFDREHTNKDWTNIVQDIVRRFANWRPGCGVMNTRCEGDDPYDVLMDEGKSQQIWIIEFTVDYFFESGITP